MAVIIHKAIVQTFQSFSRWQISSASSEPQVGVSRVFSGNPSQYWSALSLWEGLMGVRRLINHVAVPNDTPAWDSSIAALGRYCVPPSPPRPPHPLSPSAREPQTHRDIFGSVVTDKELWLPCRILSVPIHSPYGGCRKQCQVHSSYLNSQWCIKGCGGSENEMYARRYRAKDLPHS